MVQEPKALALQKGQRNGRPFLMADGKRYGDCQSASAFMPLQHPPDQLVDVITGIEAFVRPVGQRQKRGF